MKKIRIEFETKKIIFRNKENGYTIANIKINKHPKNIEIPTAEPIIAGYFNAIHVKDEFEVNGIWVDTGENGYRFNVETSTLIFPETEKGMIEFLTRFAKGVGKTSAKRIVNKFKENTFNVIINNPNTLLEVEGITEKKVNAIHESIKECRDYEDVVLFLAPLGLNHLDILKIYKELGYSTINIVSENPYILYKYKILSFKEIDLLAKKLKIKPNNPERIKTGILFFIEQQMKNRGDMFVYEKDIIEKLPQFLYQYGSFGGNYTITNDEIKLVLNSLISFDKKLVSESTLLGDKAIYINFYNFIEDEIVKHLYCAIENVNPINSYNKDIDKFLKTYELKTGFKLAKKQKEAVYMAMNNRFSILSGGPGTGKTQTINTIINCFKTIRPNSTIELAAPTGRAAKRMTELTGLEAKTIHRLIGLNSFKEEKSDLEEIDVDFLIIDEASMIDAYVFYNLLSVISETTKVLIVGDYQQLPSVGVGLVLRDLIDSKVIATTILTEVFRQKEGSQIIENAHKVINGNNHLSLDKNKGDFYFIEETSVKKISDLIILSIKRLLQTGYKMDDIQVLSTMNKGDLGVVELNRKIQATFNPAKENKDEIEIGTQKCFRVNDKVMQTENDYDLGVFNGEVGTIETIVYGENNFEVTVNFGDKDITYTNKNIHELVLAYAITVHKSQGSEFEAVIMPFHHSLNVLLNRNIIYTGLTRAKKRVVCIGDKEEFNEGINKTDIVSRNSQIKEKLIAKIAYSNSSNIVI